MNKHMMIALAVLEVVLVAVKLLIEARDAKRRQAEQRFLVRVLGPGSVDPIADCRAKTLTWILVALVTFTLATSLLVG
jgi:hypothetical protein